MVGSSQIIGGAGNKERSDRDFYPTPKEATAALMGFLENNCGFRGLFLRNEFFKEDKVWRSKIVDKDAVIWEPAVGSGAMLDVMSNMGYSVLGTDIRFGNDFLTNFELPDDVIAIITNPPFKLAEEFIRHALSFNVPVVAMLTKATYWNTAKRLKLFKEHAPTWVLPMTWRLDFDGRGSPTMDHQWNVWVKDDFSFTRFVPLGKPDVKK